MKKLLKKEYLLFIALLIAGLGLIAGVFVTQQQQDIRNRAAEPTPLPVPCQITVNALSSGSPLTIHPDGIFRNWGGLKEKWFWNKKSIWYYILPSGNVYEWKSLEAGAGKTNDPLIVTDPNCYDSATPTSTPTLTPTGSPTPSLTPANTPTNTPTSSPTNTPTNTPTPTSGVGGFRPTVTPTRRPTITPTRRPTTTPIATASPTLVLLPTLTPTPFIASEPPTLTVTSFTNSKKESPSSFTISGSSSPNAQITIEISPDGIFGTATADENGQWRYIITQKLTPGAKQLRVTATDINGVSTTYTDDFTVAKGGLGAWIWIILGLTTAIGIFIIIRRRMNPPPPYIPPTPIESGPTNETQTASEASPFVPEQPPSP